MIQIEASESDAEVRTGWVLDNFPVNIYQMEALQEAGILPDLIFCLRDSDGHQGNGINIYNFWILLIFIYLFTPTVFGTCYAHFIALCFK